MSPTEGGRRGGEAMAAAKGALLIGLAVVIGVVLLQQVDKSKSAAAPATTTTKPKETTSTTATSTSSTAPTTTVAAQPAKPPSQLRVLVLNASGRAGAAGNMSDHIRSAGYTNQDQPGDATKHQTGTTVMCKPGLTRDASALAVSVGSGTPVPVVALDATLAPSPTNAECFVVVGA
jgi:hypothetical protein